ncbi:MAG TPA: NAD(P)/FAD-dependent oxidoreductase [Herpetosiphonaceae bacterium]|nr:NAD(P)/FAD-dependent oxidoreductase [Herpetosiphonaceae bacterium]
MEQEWEVLVIGGGPAGLSAALYLARFDRRVALFDTGYGRSSWHQINHNYLGFPGGIAARELRARGRRQVEEYEQVTFLDNKVERLRRENGLFVASGQAGEWVGRAVILCTGVVDHYPVFDGWEEYVGRSMFWCITCDGYGCRDARVAVIGNTNAAASEALQLQRFTPRLSVITDSANCEIDDRFQRRLRDANIALIHDKIAAAQGSSGQFEAILLEGGERIELDQLFSQHGATANTKLGEDVGVVTSREGYLCVDTEQKTNVAGVFAAGDVTRLHSHQISTAVHEGGQAATAANYYLYPPELKDD